MKKFTFVTFCFTIGIALFSLDGNAQAPVNDDCANAIQLVYNTTCVYTSGTVQNATPSGLTSCNVATPYDIWYEVIPSTASFNITFHPSGLLDPAIQIFSGNCLTLNSINCSNSFGMGADEIVCINNVSPGTSYFIRLYDFNAPLPGTNTFQICVSNCVPIGIPEITNTSTFKIAPNPASTLSTISFGEEQKNATLIITDVLGNKILQSTFSGLQTNIDISTAASGIYFVTLINGNKQQVQKLIKE